MDHVGASRTVASPDERAVTIGPIEAAHVDELFHAFAQVVADGGGYPQTPPLTRPVFEDVWVRPVTVTVAAVVDGRFAGAYYLRPNQPGLGAHIANAGYVVAPAQRGSGIGRLLIEDSIERAPLAGFDAVQFNFVFESNRARSLYEDLGWRVVGTIPDAVPAAGGGREAALVYWRAVGPPAPTDGADHDAASFPSSSSVSSSSSPEPPLAGSRPAPTPTAEGQPVAAAVWPGAHPPSADPAPAGDLDGPPTPTANGVPASNGAGPHVTGPPFTGPPRAPAGPPPAAQAFDLLQTALGTLATVDTTRLRAEIEAAMSEAGTDGLRHLVEGILRNRRPD